jgi:Spy/CpxP family protein refolding chaperone
MMYLRGLDLSEAQREQFRGIHEQNREAAETAAGRVRVAREALQDAVTAGVVNEGAIRAVAAELGAAEGDAAVQRAYVHTQVLQVLTPDQQAAAEAAEAEMKQRLGQRRERTGERRERRQERRQQG